MSTICKFIEFNEKELYKNYHIKCSSTNYCFKQKDDFSNTFLVKKYDFSKNLKNCRIYQMFLNNFNFAIP